MKNCESAFVKFGVGLLALGSATAALAQSEIVVTGPSSQSGPITPSVGISTWAQRDAVSAVEVSPDGKHLLLLRMEGGNKGENVLEIYDTNDFSKPLRRLNSKPMEMVGASWVSDTHIFGTAWKVVRKSVTRPEEDIRSYKAFAYNLETNKFAEADGTFRIARILPNEPGKVLVEEGTAVADATGVDPAQARRPRSYFKFDLNTGARSLVLKGSEKYPNAIFDSEGRPRFTEGQDGTNSVYYYRGPNDSSWKEFSEKYDSAKYENLYRILSGLHGFQGVDGDDSTKGYITDNRGEDKVGLYEFDFTNGKIGKKLYSNPDADVLGIQRHSMRWAGNTKVVAALYSGAKVERHWFDMEEKALYESLEKKIQYAHQISITSRSRDGNIMIVFNTGPKDPGSYWFIKDGKGVKLASENPGVKGEDLNDVEFVKYPARDGKMIPAYITIPKGKAPFPLVVIPHGGPAVNEVVGYDEWGQMLANAGYMVLQPEYRMSTGWGQSHFDSAYGQHGLAMQDDKDDGALYLVKEGLADKNRMAMFGWSYGGYAALVATQRTPQIYQCAIAGAAVADPEKQYLGRKSPYDPKAFDEWSKRRGTIGINPIKNVANANIPLLMIHGRQDRRVQYYHMIDYKAAMEKAGKTNAQYITLEGADHFYNTLMYDHQTTLYTKMLDYLKKDCGPGGL